MSTQEIARDYEAWLDSLVPGFEGLELSDVADLIDEPQAPDTQKPAGELPTDAEVAAAYFRDHGEPIPF